MAEIEGAKLSKTAVRDSETMPSISLNLKMGGQTGKNQFNSTFNMRTTDDLMSKSKIHED